MPRTVWYPGHMAKGRRELSALAGALDLLLEVRDARAPSLTASRSADDIQQSLPVWIILSKADLADASATKEWLEYFKGRNIPAWALDLRKDLPASLKSAISNMTPSSSSRARYRDVRAAVIGTPNVGKSTLLNRLVGRRAALVGGVPGVTKGVSWFKGQCCLVADSPGILDPHSDKRAHRMLAWIGSTRGQVIGSWEDHAAECADFLLRHGMSRILSGVWEIDTDCEPREIIERVGIRLGRLLPGGGVDTEAAGKAIIDALYSGKLGRFTLERPSSLSPWEELA
ncbi:ribosome biogenesis GTPase A [Synergistales bacterium]|nr:ribosome biogenesis GTPase A [Synergistales bacterium]